MKRIGIVSDSHGDSGHLQQALLKLEADGPLDALLHCGDGARDMRFIPGNILQVVAVRGNCDGWTDEYPEEMQLSIGGVSIFICHGHHYSVKHGTDLYAQIAASRGAQVACFGHTHQPFCAYESGVLLINPGACAYTGHCALLSIDNRGAFSAQLL